MSQATLNQLAHAASARRPGHRLLPRARARPPAVRAGAAVLVEDDPGARARDHRGRARVGLTPVAVARPARPDRRRSSVAGLIVEQVLVGLAFAFAVARCSPRSRSAGALADIGLGLLVRRARRPDQRHPGRRVSRALHAGRPVLFLAIGGDAWMLRGLARTFQLVPLTSGAADQLARRRRRAGVRHDLRRRIEVAAPVLLALLVTDVAFGLVSRAVPAAERVRGRLPGQDRRRAAASSPPRCRSSAAGSPISCSPRSAPPSTPSRSRELHGQRRQDREADTQAPREARKKGQVAQERRPQQRARRCSAGLIASPAIGPDGRDRRGSSMRDDLRADRASRRASRPPPGSTGCCTRRLHTLLRHRSRPIAGAAWPRACSPTSPRSASRRRLTALKPDFKRSTRSRRQEPVRPAVCFERQGDRQGRRRRRRRRAWRWSRRSPTSAQRRHPPGALGHLIGSGRDAHRAARCVRRTC